MARGYLVRLGDGALGAGDMLAGPTIGFVPTSTLGTGSWTWSGTDAATGTTVTNLTDTGTYHLAEDGNVYFVPDTTFAGSLTTATTTTTPSYDASTIATAGDDTIIGDGTDELIYGGPDTSGIGTGNDTITGGAGSDNIYAGDGNDIVDGGIDGDTLYGGDGNDTLFGDSQTTATPATETLRWELLGTDGTDISGGFSQDTGGMNVMVDFNNDGNMTGAAVSTTPQFTGFSFADFDSSVRITGDNSGLDGETATPADYAPTSTISLVFTADQSSGLANEVGNISFLINDVDSGVDGWIDQITVNAYDINGNPVDVDIYPAFLSDSVFGQTVTAGSGDDTPDREEGSAEVFITGPAHYVEIIYTNAGVGAQDIWLTDVNFLTQPASIEDADALFGDAGDDTLYGGIGNDTLDGGADSDLLYGGIGDDTLDGGTGTDRLYAGDGNDTLTDTSGANSLYGGAGDDSLTTGTGNDRLEGGTGNDTLTAAAGTNTLFGDAGQDTLYGGTDQDRLYGGDGDDRLFGGTGNDSLYGGTGADTLSGDAGNDYISGGNDNDLLFGGNGDDSLYGQDGDDVLHGQGNADFLDGGTGNDTLFGGGQDDTLTGGDGMDVLDGGTGDDTLYGAADNDTLFGGEGNDSLAGGIGDDSIAGDDGNDDITGDSGQDILEGGLGDDTLAGGAAGDTLDGGDGIDMLFGGTDDDLLMGGNNTDTLFGGTGNDTLQGGDGNDTLDGGEGDNSLSGGAGDDTFTLLTDFGSDTITGGETGETTGDILDASALTDNITLDLFSLQSGNPEMGTLSNGISVAQFEEIERVILGSGDDSVRGSDGNDQIETGAGNDNINGNDGDDLIYSGSGDDTIQSGIGNDIIYAGDGNDFVMATNGNDTVFGGAGDDDIAASIGSDVKYGGDGNDTITAGGFAGAGDLMTGDAGNDTLIGGLGDDTIYGGTGDDTITSGAGYGTDIIEGGEDISGLDIDTLILKDIAGDGLTVTFTGDESGTFTSLGETDTSTFTQIEALSLSALNDTVDATASTVGVTIDAAAGDDSITGSDADDTLTGGTGADTILGGKGADSIDLGNDGDQDTIIIRDGDGDDTLINFTLPTDLGGGLFAGGDQLDVSGLTNFDGSQVSTDDVSIGDDINGDAVIGFPNGASITLVGISTAQISNPAILAAMGIPLEDQTVEGTSGDDIIDVNYVDDPEGDLVDNSDALDGSNNDLIEAYGGNDTAFGGAGNDTVYGGDGNDSVIGEDGDDTLFGDAGSDFLNGVTGNDTLFGGAGDDFLESGAGNDTTYGDAGNDSLNGDLGDDTVFGGAGDDYVRGSFGNDTVYGGTGDDYVWGGYGDDLHVVENDFGNDTYFGDSEDEILGDTLDLSLVTDDLTIDLRNGVNEIGSFTDGTYTATYEEIEHIILGAGTDTLQLGDQSGSDTVQGFSGPTLNANGTWTSGDLLDVSALTSDFGSTPVNVTDVTVTDDGNGNAVLTFPAGENLTLIGISPSAINNPLALQAMGIPLNNGIVEGTSGDDLIDTAYIDTDDDRVDNNDAVLAGTSGNDDLIKAGAGNDTVLAGDGNDIVQGEAGNDTLDGGTGNDELRGGTGNDTFSLTQISGSDTLYGGDDTDLIEMGDTTGGTGANITFTGDGAGGYTLGAADGTFSGIEHINTTAFDDTLDAQAATTSVTAFGGAGNDSFLGGTGNDTFEGLADNDTLDGGAGDDHIDGGAGDDSLTGGAGNDEIIGDAGADIISDGAGNDTVYAGTGDDTVIVGTGDDFIDTAEGTDTITLGDNAGTNTLYGGTGDTTIGDTLDGSAVTEDVTLTMATNSRSSGTFSSSGGTSTFGQIERFVTGSGNDTFIGSSQGDQVITGAGNDTLIGNGGGDALFAGDGDDLFIIGNDDGTDSLLGGTGTDTISFDTTTGGGITVTFSGDDQGSYNGAGNSQGTFDEIESIIASAQSDTVNAATSTVDLTLSGLAGNDNLTGGSGNDTLDGGTGNDTISAGAGDDTITLADGFGTDTITGGDSAETAGDTLDMSAVTQDITLDLSNSGQTGTATAGSNTASFSEIENITLGSGLNTVALGGADADRITGFTGPTDTGAGTFAGNDQLDTSAISGANTDNTIVTDDGAGNAVLTFTNGATLTLIGISPATLATPAALNAMGIPLGGTSDGTVSGTAGDDSIDLAYLGDPDGDRIDNNDATLPGATANDDLILAGDGNDTITAGDGNDEIYGGAGADRIHIDQASGIDTIDGGESAGDNDRLDFSTTTGGQGVNVTFTGDEQGGYDVATGSATGTFTAIEEVVGSNFDDTITGNAGADRLYGGAGADSLSGGAADDLLYGGGGDDTLSGGTGNDTLLGNSDSDTFVATDGFGDDIVIGGTGGTDFDTLDLSALTNPVTVTFTGAGAGTVTDTVTGDTIVFSEIEQLILTPQSDVVDASADNGYTQIQTLGGDDSILGSAGNDIYDEEQGPGNGQGNDTFHGEGGDDSIWGGTGSDVLFGGTGNDFLDGEEGSDTLYGGLGQDNLVGGAGNDTLIAAEGDDVFGGTGNDTIFLDDLGETSNTTIDVFGGDGFDTLDIGSRADVIAVRNAATNDGSGILSGSVTLFDGTTLNFAGIENIICFTPGTRIATPQGARPIETLAKGDLVLTRDHGLQPIRWIGTRTVPGTGDFAPIHIRPGVMAGLETDLYVSPQHRMLFQGYRAELLFGESEVLVPAKHLIDGKSVTQDARADVTYIHMIFDEHEIVFAEGAASESFHPGDMALNAITEAARQELFTLFPDLASMPQSYGGTARRCLRKHEAALLKA